MLSNSAAFSGFAVNDIDTARAFYQDTLGLVVELNDIAWFRNPAGNVLSVLTPV